MILLGVLWPLENLGETAADCFEFVHRIAGHDRADRRAADDQHLVRHRVHHRAERAAGDGKAAEHHDQQDDDPDRSKHVRIPLCAAAVSAADRTG